MFGSFEDVLISIALIGLTFGADTLNQFSEDHFSNSLGGYLKDSGAALELYRAMQLSYPDESLLEKQNSRTSYFLKQGLSNVSLCGDRLRKNIIGEVLSFFPLSSNP
jgi:ent-kaurene synthase